MRQLKNYHIYQLPAVERRLYLASTAEGAHLLYDCELGTRVPPRFEITADRRIFNWHGEDTGWTVDDLLETGEIHSP